jgi:hypothetical protein
MFGNVIASIMVLIETTHKRIGKYSISVGVVLFYLFGAYPLAIRISGKNIIMAMFHSYVK